MTFFSGVLLAAAALPAAGAAPASTASVSATLAGPNGRPCGGPVGTVPVGTAVIQSGRPKDAVPTDQRALRVNVAADSVRARTTYNVVLAATVMEQIGDNLFAVGCRYWSAGTAAVNGNGRLTFSEAVTVPRHLSSFEVLVSPDGPTDVGYTTPALSVAGL